MILRAILEIDGVAFSLIGIIVMFIPSPQPTLTRDVDPQALGPFIDTRRLLATQFIGVGLLTLVVGVVASDMITLQLAGAARVLTLAIVIAVNVSQLRNGAWKRGSLLGLISIFSALGVIYSVLIAIG